MKNIIALVIPINTAIVFAFNRRERALNHISRIRSCSYQIYLSHCIWDWGNTTNPGRVSTSDVHWLEHTDQVLQELIGLGDELSRFLTLPTSSLTRHRMLKSGRIEAAAIIRVREESWLQIKQNRLCLFSFLSSLLDILSVVQYTLYKKNL